jgi:hypothetical protein
MRILLASSRYVSPLPELGLSRQQVQKG